MFPGSPIQQTEFTPMSSEPWVPVDLTTKRCFTRGIENGVERVVEVV